MKIDLKFFGTSGVLQQDIIERFERKLGKIDACTFKCDSWAHEHFSFTPVKNGENLELEKITWQNELFADIPDFLFKIREVFIEGRELPYGKYDPARRTIVPIPLNDIPYHRGKSDDFLHFPEKWNNSEGWSVFPVARVRDSGKDTYQYFVDRTTMPSKISEDSENICKILEEHGKFPPDSITSYIVQKSENGEFSLSPRIAGIEQKSIHASNVPALDEQSIKQMLNGQVMVMAKVIVEGHDKLPQSTGTSRVNVPCLTTGMSPCIAVALVGEGEGRAKVRLFHVFPYNDKAETSIHDKIKQFREKDGLRVRAAMLGGDEESTPSKNMADKLRTLFKNVQVALEFDKACELREKNDDILGCVVLPGGQVQFITDVMASGGSRKGKERDKDASINPHDDNGKGHESKTYTRYEIPSTSQRSEGGVNVDEGTVDLPEATENTALLRAPEARDEAIRHAGIRARIRLATTAAVNAIGDVACCR